MKLYTKYYQIGDISIEVRSELPITEKTFQPKFKIFEIDQPSNIKMIIDHRFEWDENIFKVSNKDQHYNDCTWRITRKDDHLIYQWIESSPSHNNVLRQVKTDIEHEHVIIYNDNTLKQRFLDGNLHSLSMFPTDQILLGGYLANKQGCILHSLGIILNNKGFLFVGHSDAGKSTMANIMKKESIILCDDRNIVRKQKDGFKVYGTWSHGDVKDISSVFSSLNAIFFLKKAKTNEIELIQDKKIIINNLLACIIRPATSTEWWNKSIDLISDLANNVPCFNLRSNKDPKIFNLIKQLSDNEVVNGK